MYRIANEVDAVVGGLIAQEQQPIFLGTIPDPWKPAIELQREMYYAGLEYLVPGRPFAEFMDMINNFGAKRGMKSQLLMHGRGYGDDGPFLRRKIMARVIAMCGLKKTACLSSSRSPTAPMGPSIPVGAAVCCVTEKGGEPLVKRTPGMVEIK